MATSESNGDFICVGNPSKQCGRTTVGTDCLECSLCNCWFHQSCQNLNKSVFNYFSSTKAPFICLNCARNELPSILQGKDFMKTVSGRLDSFESTMNETLQRVSSIEQKLDFAAPPFVSAVKQVVSDSLKLEKSMSVPLQEQSDLRLVIREEMLEIREREKRKSSIVIKSIQCDNMDSFLVKFQEVAHRLVGAEVELTDVAPVGGNMVRASISNSESRVELLSKSSQLKNTDFSHIYVNKDLTFKQRSELRARRADRSGPVGLTGANSIPALVPRISAEETPGREPTTPGGGFASRVAAYTSSVRLASGSVSSGQPPVQSFVPATDIMLASVKRHSPAPNGKGKA